ncbi:MAG: hypothetical protein IJR03_00240 [Bacteroidales bacterium]|nr:hypothetical protein [Bacteroidales bacterium]
MKHITRLIIEEYNLRNIDFMGYYFNKNNASYHHLIVPKRFGGEETVANGAVLNGLTSHPYLHAIENIDYDRFLAITSEIIDEKALGRLDGSNLKRIDDILRGFEKEYAGRRTSKGKILIKPSYISERILTSKR